MKKENDKTVRLLLKSGQNISLYASEDSLVELASHPKFVPMYDDSNSIMISIEDVSAFEILDNRKVIPLIQPTEQPIEVDVQPEPENDNHVE